MVPSSGLATRGNIVVIYITWKVYMFIIDVTSGLTEQFTLWTELAVTLRTLYRVQGNFIHSRCITLVLTVDGEDATHTFSSGWLNIHSSLFSILFIMVMYVTPSYSICPTWLHPRVFPPRFTKPRVVRRKVPTVIHIKFLKPLVVVPLDTIVELSAPTEDRTSIPDTENRESRTLVGKLTCRTPTRTLPQSCTHPRRRR